MSRGYSRKTKTARSSRLMQNAADAQRALGALPPARSAAYDGGILRFIGLLSPFLLKESRPHLRRSRHQMRLFSSCTGWYQCHHRSLAPRSTSSDLSTPIPGLGVVCRSYVTRRASFFFKKYRNFTINGNCTLFPARDANCRTRLEARTRDHEGMRQNFLGESWLSWPGEHFRNHT